jgi:C4-dicarboxylate transporter DctM subunit
MSESGGRALAFPGDGVLARFYAVLVTLSKLLAMVGVGGMLVVAAVTVIDIVLQSGFGKGVVAINEVTAMAFAVAITACIPAGLVDGVNLKIDIFARWINGRLAVWLEAVGMIVLLLFFLLLTFEIYTYAQLLSTEKRTTVILGWPVAPFLFVASAILVVGVLVQVLITASSIARAVRFRRPENEVKYPVATLLAVLMIAAALGALAWLFLDFEGASNWARANPTAAVGFSLAGLWILMFGQIPLAAVTATMGIIACSLLVGFEPATKAFATEAYGLLTNSQIATLPLFLMMGSFAAVSGMADDVYQLSHLLFGRFRGGLAYATIGSSAGFGALTGSSVATAATVGRIAIPEMRRRGYSPALATGVCAAGGTLGPIVPPGSAPLIIFAILTEVSIGKLFVASVGPALLTIFTYLTVIYFYVRLAPKSAPPASGGLDARELTASLVRCIPVAVLVFGVMGGLYFGVFNDIQSAAVGAIGAFAVAAWRGKLNRKALLDVMVETTATTAMIYALMMGAMIFSLSISLSGTAETLVAAIGAWQFSPPVMMTLIVIGYLLLGMVMEAFAIMIITVPIIMPLIQSLGYDPLWWGIVMLCVVETGMIHPPFGINVIVLKGITPDVSLWTIYKGVAPFVAADLVKLALLIAFPVIALWLPYAMG